MANFRAVSHVIFDVDGLLLDTEKFYTIANRRILIRFGHEFTWELKEMQMGRSQRDAVNLLVDSLKLPVTVDDYVAEMTEIVTDLFPQAELMPGAERLVRHLHRQHVPMALCTGSRASHLALKTRRHQQLFSLFSHVVCSSDDPQVLRGKPAPDCFLVAASRFADRPSPEQVLVFEDARNGVEAALGARMQVVMVPDPRVGPEVRASATLTIASLSDFKPELFSLPSFAD